MPAEITMPQLSDTMSEGTVVKWLKKEGERVKAGEVIAEVETDKATMEMEAFESGTLALIEAKEGQKVKVGQRIAVLAAEGESVEDVKREFSAKPAHVAPPAAAATGEISAQPPAAATAAPIAVAADTTRAAEPDISRVRISPLARRIAADKGVDLSRIRGSGPGGRIVQRDIEAALTGKAPVVQPAVQPEVPAMTPRIAPGQVEVVELTKMRATIAQRLQQSKQTIPHFYETIDIDVEQLSQMRQSLNRQFEPQGIRLSIGDFVTRAVALALVRHPQLNAHFNGAQIRRFGDVHLGMAVALPEGLIVPVLRNADKLDLKEIRQRSADLVQRARAQKLKAEELSGATFTVSNLGTHGLKEFSAIINPPEVGILAVGLAEKRPVVVGDSIAARTVMTVTLSADHRAVDGAAAAEFLVTLRQLLQEPWFLLM